MSNGLNIFALSLASICCGCANYSPEKLIMDLTPKMTPVRSVTGFDEVFTCVGKMLPIKQNKIRILIDNMVDKTGTINVGGKEMITNGLVKMLQGDGAFSVIDYPYDSPSVLALQTMYYEESKSLENKGALEPNYYISASITNHDIVPYSSGFGLGFVYNFFSGSFFKQQAVHAISAHMHVRDFKTNEVVGGITSTNTITVSQSQSQVRASGVKSSDNSTFVNTSASDVTISTGSTPTAGITINIELGDNQGLHAAVQKLVEISLVEVIGKLFNIQYQTCIDKVAY
jgi:hypothetical protein